MGGTTDIDDDIKAIIDRALKDDSSVIHIDDMDDYTLIRYRVDGRLKLANKLTKNTDNLTKKIFDWLNIDKRNVLREVKADYLGRNFRVNVLPSVSGYKITMMFDKLKTRQKQSLGELGLYGKNLKELNLAISSGRGVIILSSSDLDYIDQVNSALIEKLNLKPKIANLKTGISIESKIKSDYQIISSPLTSLKTAQLSSEHFKEKLFILRLATNSRLDLLKKLNVLGYRKPAEFLSVKLILNFKTMKKRCLFCRENIPSNESSVDIIEKGLGIKNRLTTKEIKELKKSLSENVGLKDSSYGKSNGCEKCNYSGYYGKIGVFECLKLANKNNRFSLIKIGETMEVDGLIKSLLGLVELKDIVDIN